jgi:hypothetical protein
MLHFSEMSAVFLKPVSIFLKPDVAYIEAARSGDLRIAMPMESQ